MFILFLAIIQSYCFLRLTEINFANGLVYNTYIMLRILVVKFLFITGIIYQYNNIRPGDSLINPVKDLEIVVIFLISVIFKLKGN